MAAPLASLVVPGLWVAILEWSKATATKLSVVHGLQADEVESAVQCRSNLEYVWDEDPDRGLRALVEVRIRSQIFTVVLYPRGDDVYSLGSCISDVATVTKPQQLAEWSDHA